MLPVEPDLNDMIVFVRVVESGSFTAAAQLLHLPKSSVSRKVTRLENQLGIRLLQRTTRSLTLTAAGRTYFERASRVVAELDDIHATVAGFRQTPRGPLRLTAPLSFEETGKCLYFDFLEAYPEVSLEVSVTDRYVDLVQEGFDLAIRGGKPPDPSLTGLEILKSHLQILASPAYLAKHGRPLNPSDLRNHECFVHGLRSPSTWHFLTSRGAVEVTVKGRFASSNMMTLIEAAKRGLGIIRVPTGGQGIDIGDLEVLLPEYTHPSRGLWLVFKSNRQVSPTVRAFIDFVEDYFA